MWSRNLNYAVLSPFLASIHQLGGGCIFVLVNQIVELLIWKSFQLYFGLRRGLKLKFSTIMRFFVIFDFIWSIWTWDSFCKVQDGSCIRIVASYFVKVLPDPSDLGVAQISNQSGWYLVDFFRTTIVVNVDCGGHIVLEQNDNFTESDWSKKSTWPSMFTTIFILSAENRVDCSQWWGDSPKISNPIHYWRFIVKCESRFF